jgi:hypothetical protein
MLEVIILFILAGKIGKIVEEKGRKKIGYQVMLVGLWMCGEVLGGTLGLLTALIAESDEAAARLVLVPFALGGAIIGSVIAFQIAKRVSPLDADDGFNRSIEFADQAGVRERFRDRQAAPPIHDAFTDNADNARRPFDDQIQE